MNLPNKLTMLRIILIPFFMGVLYMGFPGCQWVALAIFIVASFTDLLDGKIARKYNLVTDFGKFADPLADKMLTTAVYLALISNGYCNIWILFIILFREFGISSIRLVAAAQGVVIPANMWGKVKTFSMMIFTGFIFLLLSLQRPPQPTGIPLTGKLLTSWQLWASTRAAPVLPIRTTSPAGRWPSSYLVW